MTIINSTVFAPKPDEGGKGGEGGVLMTNADFVAAVFPSLPDGAFVTVCSKAGDPCVGGWVAHRADVAIGDLSAEQNNFVGCSSFYPGGDGSFKARKAQFAACHFLMLDDLGTKIPLERLAGFELSLLIQTNHGNHQGGIMLANPITDCDMAVRLLNAVISSKLCDAGANGPLSRWARLPVAINGKPKHVDEAGAPFRCRLVEWRPYKRYTPQEIVHGLQLKLALASARRLNKETKSTADNYMNIVVWFSNQAEKRVGALCDIFMSAHMESLSFFWRVVWGALCSPVLLSGRPTHSIPPTRLRRAVLTNRKKGLKP